MEKAIAVARQSVSLILLVVASFHLATAAHAQADYSFDRWLEARDIAGRDPNTGRLALSERKWRDLMSRGNTPAQQLSADLKQYEKNKAEATKRGISFVELLTEVYFIHEMVLAKQARDRTFRKLLEYLINGAVVGAVIAAVVVVIVIVFKARHRITTPISRRWRRQSKGFRTWAFGSACWIIGTLLFVWLAEPYGSRMFGDEYRQMLSTMIIPPLFAGAIWFGYKRFVV